MTNSSTQVQSLVLHGVHDLRMETRSLDIPAADEVQVSVLATGLCGSDLHYYHHYRNGDILVREPLSLGHESAGIITAVGSNAKDLLPGDSVALEVGVPCSDKTCEYCSPTTSTTKDLSGTTPASSRYNLCPHMRFRSSAKSFPHYQGTLQQKLNHPAAWCHKLPSSLSLTDGALLEPLSVALHACRRSGLAQTPNASVLIFGAGAVGLLCAYMAKLEGASKVLIADINWRRVEFAVEKGFADAGFVVPRSAANTGTSTTTGAEKNMDKELAGAQSMAQAIAATCLSSSNPQSNGITTANGITANIPFGSPHVTFECTGVEACVQTSIFATRPGGKVMLVGMGTPIQTLPLSAAALREVDLLGVFRYAGTYKEGIDILSAAKEKKQKKAIELPDLSSLITHRFRGLENAGEAFEMAGKTVDQQGNLVLKVLVELANEDENEVLGVVAG